MAYIKNEYTEDCACNDCNTWATITEYSCGCVTVEIHRDREPCDRCTDFSGKKEYCDESGHPSGHDDD